MTHLPTEAYPDHPHTHCILCCWPHEYYKPGYCNHWRADWQNFTVTRHLYGERTYKVNVRPLIPITDGKVDKRLKLYPCLKRRELTGRTNCVRRKAVAPLSSRRAQEDLLSPSARGTMTFEWPSTARGRSAGGAGRCEESGRRSTSAPSASWSTTAPRNASRPTGTTTTQESAPPDATIATTQESATRCT